MSIAVQNLIEVLNTSVEIFLIYLYFSLLSHGRRKRAAEVFGFIASTACISLTVLFSSETLMYFAVTAAILLFAAFVFFKNSPGYGIFLVLIYLLIISIADPIVIILLSAAGLGSPEELLMSSLGRYIGMLGVDILYLWLIGLVHRIIKKRIRTIPAGYWLLIILIPIISIFILQFMVGSIRLDDKGRDYYIISMTVLGLIYINVSMFRLFESYENTIRLNYLEGLKKQEEENYKLLTLSYKQVRELKHDIENQFTIVSELLKQGDTEGAEIYLDKISKFVRTANRICYTGNNAVDSIVNIKGDVAKEQGIEFICKINILTSIKADETELCRILGNALDNAIEGCGRVKCKDKHIFLSINEDKENLTLLITNTSEEVDTNYLHSDKSGFHGIGVNSIKASVQRLNGFSKFSYEDGIFTLTIVVINS